MDSIRVIYHHEPPDGWWAESPDLPGYYAAGESYDEVRELVEEGMVESAHDHGVALAMGTTLEHYVPAPVG